MKGQHPWSTDEQELRSLRTDNIVNRGTLSELPFDPAIARGLLKGLLAEGRFVWLDEQRGPDEYGPDEVLPLGIPASTEHELAVAQAIERGGW